MALLLLMGIYASIRYSNWRGLATAEKWILWFAGLYFLVSLAATAYGDWSDTGVKKLEKHARILAFIPIYLLVRQSKPSEGTLWWGIAMGCFATGGQALYQHFVLHIDRVTGANNFIHFGNLTLIMGFMSLAGTSYFKRFKWGPLIPIAAFVCGVFASMLTGTRGAWIAIPVLILILVLPYFRKGSPALKFTLALLFVSLCVNVYLIPQTGVSQRIHKAVEDIETYQPGKTWSSIGLRFENWRTSYQIIQQHPLTGIGLGRYKEAAEPYVEQGFASQGILNWDHPHNEYLATLVSRGIIGVVVLLGLLWVPFYVFFQAFLFSSHQQPKRIALAGSLLMAAYIVHGIPNNIFERGISLSFFVCVLSLTLALLYNYFSAQQTATSR